MIFPGVSRKRLRRLCKPDPLNLIRFIPVSYTHLDVYKRQIREGGRTVGSGRVVSIIE